MATTFKTLRSKDVVATRTMLHEAIPITGTIVSGTYNDLNIKNYSHGIFQSVFDYPYLSSSANHIFDLTAGYANGSALSSSVNVQNSKKVNIYNEMAQILVGFDETGSVRNFDEDGDLTGGTKNRECFFLNFTRLLQKDEIKKGSFTLELGVSASTDEPFATRILLQDISASDQYKVNSPAGEYGILYANNSAANAEGTTPLKNPTHSTTAIKAGLIFYQAGIVVVTASLFSGSYDVGNSREWHRRHRATPRGQWVVVVISLGNSAIPRRRRGHQSLSDGEWYQRYHAGFDWNSYLWRM